MSSTLSDDTGAVSTTFRLRFWRVSLVYRCIRHDVFPLVFPCFHEIGTFKTVQNLFFCAERFSFPKEVSIAIFVGGLLTAIRVTERAGTSTLQVGLPVYTFPDSARPAVSIQQPDIAAFHIDSAVSG